LSTTATDIVLTVAN